MEAAVGTALTEQFLDGADALVSAAAWFQWMAVLVIVTGLFVFAILAVCKHGLDEEEPVLVEVGVRLEWVDEAVDMDVDVYVPVCVASSFALSIPEPEDFEMTDAEPLDVEQETVAIAVSEPVLDAQSQTPLLILSSLSFEPEQPQLLSPRICQCKSDPASLERHRQMEFKFEGTMRLCECERIEAGCEVSTGELKASINRLYRTRLVEKVLAERGYGPTADFQDVALEGAALKRRQDDGQKTFDKHRPAGVVKRDQEEWRYEVNHIAFNRRNLPAYLRHTAFVQSRFKA